MKLAELKETLNNLIVEMDGAIAVVTINRPKALNALNAETLEEIKKTMESVSYTHLKVLGSKYSRSKVRKALPKEFAYIIEELLHEDRSDTNKQMYFNEIIETIIRLYQADRFIISISNLIQRLAIDQLHVIGDIYDLSLIHILPKK